MRRSHRDWMKRKLTKSSLGSALLLGLFFLWMIVPIQYIIGVPIVAMVIFALVAALYERGQAKNR